MQRAVVVFPQPLSPTKPNDSPCPRSKLTSSTARVRPVTFRRMPGACTGKYLQRPRTVSSGSLIPAGVADGALRASVEVSIIQSPRSQEERVLRYSDGPRSDGT